MSNEKEKLKLIIDHLDSAYSKKIRTYEEYYQDELNAEWWQTYNRLVGDDVDTWYDYIVWLMGKIG